MEPERPARRGRMWIWPVVVGTLVVVIVILVALLLAPRDAVPTATSTGTPAPTVTPTPTPTPTEAQTPTPTPTDGAPAITDEDRAAIAAAISSHDTVPLLPYLPEQTMVILCASEAYGLQTRDGVQSDLGTFLGGTHGPWDFGLPAATVAAYRAGSYAEYFPEDGLVGRSAESWIVAFQFAGAQISDIFLCPGESIVLE